jgi:hypothetical protein
MKSLRKLHTGKPYVQFERRTEASVRVTSCASSDPSDKVAIVPLKACTVIVHDLNDTAHSLHVTADPFTRG